MSETIGTARVDIVVDTRQFETAVTSAKRSVADMSQSAQEQYNRLNAAEKRRVDGLLKQVSTIGLTRAQQIAYNAALKTSGPLLDEITRKLAINEAAQRKAASTSIDAAKRVGTFVGTALVGAGIAVADLTRRAIDQADKLDEMSQRLQIGADQLSKWAYAAKLSGTDLDNLSKAIGIFSKNVAAAADPNDALGKRFADLGISVKDARGDLRSVQDLIPEVADRFKMLDNQTAETALAMQLFGRSGGELLEFLNRGGDGIRALGDELESLGGVIDNETAAAAAAFKDELDRLKTASLGFGTQVAAQLLPTLNETTQSLREMVSQGDLARNVVALISAAVSSGVGVLEAYNNAVNRVALAFEFAAKAGEGFQEIQRNLGPGGLFMEGSISEGIEKIKKASAEGDAALEALARPRQVPIEVVFAGEGAEPAGLFKRPASQTEAGRALQDRLNASLAATSRARGRSARRAKEAPDFAKDAAQELQRLVEIEARARDQFDELAATLDGPLATAALRYSQEQERLNDLAKTGAVDADSLARAQANLASNYEKERKEIEAQLNPMRALIAEKEFELKLFGMTSVERQTAIDLQRLGIDATMEEVAALRALNQVTENTAKATAQLDDFRRMGADALGSFIDGSRSAKEAIGDFFDELYRRSSQALADNIIASLFGQQGTSGTGATSGFLSWLGQAIGPNIQGFQPGGAAGEVTVLPTLAKINLRRALR